MQFEKVSFEEAKKRLDPFYEDSGFTEKDYAESIALPGRSTFGAAGYDFVSPIGCVIEPGESVVIPTGIKCLMDYAHFLMITPRSSIGIKKKLMLLNTVAVIDCDYYNNKDNEGDIFIALYNYGKDKAVIEKGDRIAQGIFLPFATVLFETFKNVKEREGGIGSTGQR